MKTVNVKLKKYYKHIIAPEHCPYQSPAASVYGDKVDSTGVVSPLLCLLCKLCEFTPDGVDLSEFSGLIKDKFVRYLIEDNYEVSASISGQNQYLRKEARLPLVILISSEVLDKMLIHVFPVIEERMKVHSLILLNEVPLCYILGCPVYFNRKLTRSSIQVVGEIMWK